MRSWLRWFTPVLPILLAAFLLAGCTNLSAGQIDQTPATQAAPATTVATVTLAPSPTPTPTAPPPATATPTPVATATLAPTATPAKPATPAPIVRAPDRDPVDLAHRLKPGPVAFATPQTPAVRKVGDQSTFWVLDQGTKKFYQVNARIAAITDHLYMYVADGVNLSSDRIRASADTFERTTYPTLHKYYGSEWSPGIDNDVHLTILNGRISGVGGYYSSSDEYPVAINQYSNEREMFYVNVDAVQPGTAAYDSTIAHEFTHMVQFNVVKGGETWISEGSAELGAKAALGSNSSFAQAYLSDPDLQLTEWSESPSESIPHYGAAYLFLNYFSQKYGSYEAVGKLLAEDSRGTASFDAYLARQGVSTTFDGIFRDWVVANYLNDSKVDGGRYSYRETGLRAQPTAVSTYPAKISGTVHQYGADYYELKGAQGDVTLAFAGDKSVSLTRNDARSGQYQWFSNRGDSVDSRLTREFDLSGVAKATLQFAAWYDVEENYDYVFVEASTDGGQTWKTLKGTSTTPSNPNGGNYGFGYTGLSGGDGRWLSEQVDLTPYAGRRVLLRFEYVTDDAYNAGGFGLDDLAIPEISYRDDAESDGGWTAEGFARTDNREPQSYAVTVITKGNSVSVQPLTLDADEKGQVVVKGVGPGQDVQTIGVAIAAMAPLTTTQASYSLSATASAP